MKQKPFMIELVCYHTIMSLFEINQAGNDMDFYATTSNSFTIAELKFPSKHHATFGKSNNSGQTEFKLH